MPAKNRSSLQFPALSWFWSVELSYSYKTLGPQCSIYHRDLYTHFASGIYDSLGIMFVFALQRNQIFAAPTTQEKNFQDPCYAFSILLFLRGQFIYSLLFTILDWFRLLFFSLVVYFPWHIEFIKSDHLYN